MTDLFTPPDPVETEVSLSLDNYVGEGKKYKTQEDFVKSRIEADKFIETLKQEARQREAELIRAREELNAQKRMEEIADRLLHSRTEPQVPPETNQSERDGSKTEITPEKIQEMVQQALQADRSKAQQDANRSAVVQTLRETLGTNYPDKLRARLSELGLSEAEANQIAAANPRAFLAMVGTQNKQEPGVQSPPRSILNTDFKPSPSGKTWSYYESMRTSTDPKVRDQYWSPAIQQEMHKVAASFGNNPEDFFK